MLVDGDLFGFHVREDDGGALYVALLAELGDEELVGDPVGRQTRPLHLGQVLGRLELVAVLNVDPIVEGRKSPSSSRPEFSAFVTSGAP